jgi:hypothetical protein
VAEPVSAGFGATPVIRDLVLLLALPIALRIVLGHLLADGIVYRFFM